jgi:hypothetical protein
MKTFTCKVSQKGFLKKECVAEYDGAYLLSLHLGGGNRMITSLR